MENQYIHSRSMVPSPKTYTYTSHDKGSVKKPIRKFMQNVEYKM